MRSAFFGAMIGMLAIILISNIVYWVRRRRRSTLVDFSDPPVLLRHWIEQSAMRAEPKEMHRHIIKHAKELKEEIEGNGSFETWSASMHNLLGIFDAVHGINPSIDLRLERMTAKYLADPSLVEPPSPIPERIVNGAKGPLIEQRRETARKEREQREYASRDTY